MMTGRASPGQPGVIVNMAPGGESDRGSESEGGCGCQEFPDLATVALADNSVLAGLGIPCFGCTPQKLPLLLEGALRGQDLQALAARVTEKTT